MRAILILLLSVLSIPQALAGANTSPAPGVPASTAVVGDFTDMKHTMSGRVESVIDAKTILLADGKLVRLLGIDYPFVAGEGMEDGGNIAGAAKVRLEQLLPKGTEVMLYQSRNVKTGRTNRMGHLLAHMVVKKTGQWINGELLEQGLAFVSTSASNPDMAAQMLAREDRARAAKRILWSDASPYGVLPADEAAKGDGQFRIVEGTVNRAASAKNNLYLNFGTDWKKDFTAMLSPALRRQLSRQGIDPMALSGQRIRVRGWLRQWNGPYMELETVERLEILD